MCVDIRRGLVVGICVTVQKTNCHEILITLLGLVFTHRPPGAPPEEAVASLQIETCHPSCHEVGAVLVVGGVCMFVCGWGDH